MEQYNIDRQTAMDCIGKLHEDLAEQFLAAWKEIPTYGGPVDREIRTYTDGLAYWVRGNDCWDFEVCCHYNLCREPSDPETIHRVSVTSESEGVRFSSRGKIHCFQNQGRTSLDGRMLR
jgi:hypothetical protein